jgi:CheY-like chemotaxis protein
MKKIDFVYIVEDDEIASFVIKLALESHASFSNNAIFQNGKLAIDMLSKPNSNLEKLPDIIFLDINMPIMDGWEFLEKFSTLTMDKSISVIILTSSINPEDAEKAKTFKHVKGFLSKPLDLEKLDQVLELI